MVTKITNNDMSKALQADIALVDFSATWCGPCKMIAPVVDELSEEMKEVAFFNADVDENDELAGKYNIMNIPALIVLKKGEVAAQTVGFQPKESLKQLLAEQM